MIQLKSRIASETEVSTAKIAFWYTISNLFVSGLGFLTTPIFARILTKAEIGSFFNFTSWEGILTIILSLNLVASINRAKFDFREEIDSYVFSILLLSNLFTLFIFVLSEIFPSASFELLSMNRTYIRLLFLDCLAWQGFQYFMAQHRVFQKYKVCVALSISSASIRVIVTLVLIHFMNDKILGRTLGYVLPFTIFGVYLWVIIAINGKRIRFLHMKYACLISVPMILHALAGVALVSADKIMIEHIFSSAEVALYSIPYTVSSVASIVWLAMNQAWSPWLFDRMDEGETKQIYKKSKWYLGVFATLIIGVLLAAPELLLFMGGTQYEEAVICMPPVILACTYQFICSMYVNIEFFTKHTLEISFATIVAAVFNIIANAFLIPIYGYQAAAYTTAAGYLLLLIIHYVLVRLRGQFTSIYDNRFVFAVGTLLTLISFGVSILYSYYFLRLIVLFIYTLIICIVGVKNRKKILQLFVKA